MFTPEECREIACEHLDWKLGKTDTSGMSAEEKRLKGQEIERRYKQMRAQNEKERAVEKARRSREIRCPNCGSDQFMGGQQGFGLGKAVAGGLLLGPVGLLSGFIGKGDVTLSCLKCGKRWKAGQA